MTATHYPNHCASKLFSSIVNSFISSLQSSEALSTQLVALESEKAVLVQSLSKVEAELAVRGDELERVQTSLATERESGVKTAEALQNQLNEKVEHCHFPPLSLISCNKSNKGKSNEHLDPLTFVIEVDVIS